MKSVKRNQVRIIGGQWRGRKLAFPDTPNLRPTPDRLRETLFNWLAPVIAGARCLDLFAGSGALGFEALSQGAAHAVMLDSDEAVLAKLKDNALALQSTQHDIIQATCCSAMPVFEEPFDIVFLDPPYHSGLVPVAATWLESECLLEPGALIYVEVAKGEDLNGLPSHWAPYRQKSTKHISYGLFKYAP